MGKPRTIMIASCILMALAIFVGSTQQVDAGLNVQMINIRSLITHENSLGLAYNPDANVLYLSHGSGSEYGHIITIDMQGNLLNDVDLQTVYRPESYAGSLSYDRTTGHLFVMTYVVGDGFATLLEMSLNGSTIYNQFPLPLDGGVGITFRDNGVWRSDYTRLYHYTRTGVVDKSIPLFAAITRDAASGPIASSINGGFFIGEFDAHRLIEIDQEGNKAGIISIAGYGRGSASAMDTDLATKRIFLSVNNETIYIIPLVTQIRPVLTLVKESQPKSVQNFAYYGPFGKFYLDDALPDDGDDVIWSKSYTVNPGTYNFAEGVFQSWHLADIVCTGGGQSSNNLIMHSVSITVKAGDQMLCTFVTQRRVDLEATIYNDLNANHMRDANEPPLRDWEFRFYTSDGSLINHKMTDANGSAKQSNVIPGSFKICETPKAGWTNTQYGLIDPILGVPCYTITLAPGQNAQLVFGVTQAPVVLNSEEIDSTSGTITGTLPDINEPESEEPFEPEVSQRVYLPLVGR